MNPIDAKTLKEICSLERDCLESGDFWLQIDEGIITICEQRKGEKAAQEINICRGNFDIICRLYMTGKKD